MITYKRERKKLIIPSGFLGGSGGCETAIEQARAEQEAADEAKLTDITLQQNGTYQAPYGYKTVGVAVNYWRYASVKFDVNYEPCLPFADFGIAPARNFKLYVNNVEYELQNITCGGSCGGGMTTSQMFKGETSITSFQSGSVEFALREYISLDNLAFSNMVNNYGTDMEQQISGATMTTEYLGEETVESGGETHIAYWYRLNFNTYGCGIYDDWQLAYDRGRNEGFTEGYQAGIATCQSAHTNNSIIIYNETNIGGWYVRTGRDLLLDGVPYEAIVDGAAYGGGWESFEVQYSGSQPTISSSITFTIDEPQGWAEQDGLDLTDLYVFGEAVTGFTFTKVAVPSQSPIYEGDITVTYTITLNDET